jgi:hypothetical protein
MAIGTMKGVEATRGMLGLNGGLLCASLLIGSVAYGQTTVPPANTAPERDSRGVPVVSDPATAPAGANQPIAALPPGAVWVANPDARAAFAPQPSAGEKPPCSRTVTDNCTQIYERRGSPRGWVIPDCPDRSNPLCPRGRH